MSENMAIYEKVRNVPKEALKTIGGGRLKGMSDINPMWRIKMLTEVFGICGIGWKIEITDKRLERGEGVEVVCFVDINLYVKVDGEWSAPIPGMGGSSFVTLEKNGPFTSDECFKMAYTDAISVACKSLGFAADVYFANDRTKYSNQENQDGANEPQKPAQGTPHNPSSNHPKSNTGKTAASGDYKKFAKGRVFDLREKLGWEWSDLTKFASDVMGKTYNYLAREVTENEDWERIEKALLHYQQTGQLPESA